MEAHGGARQRDRDMRAGSKALKRGAVQCVLPQQKENNRRVKRLFKRNVHQEQENCAGSFENKEEKSKRAKHGGSNR